MALLEEFQRLLDKIDSLERKVKKLETQRDRFEFVTYEGVFNFIIGHKIDANGKPKGISRDTFANWVEAGEIKKTKLGNYNMYEVESLVNLLKNKPRYKAYLKPEYV